MITTASLACLALAATPTPAHAQLSTWISRSNCGLSISGTNYSTGAGIWANASHTNDGIAAPNGQNHIRTEAWIVGISNPRCTSPAVRYGTASCAREVTTVLNPAVANVNVVHNGPHAAGTWTAKAKFFAIDTAGTYWAACGGLYTSSFELPPVDSCYYGCQPGTPIVIATGQPTFKMTDVSHGVAFDLDGDGTPEQVSWVEDGSDTAFLAIDRNHNGTIDDGTELFGDHTVEGVSNGWDALARIEEHTGDGYIDAEDSVFSKLLLWNDRNHNGVSEAGELRPASQVLVAIGIGYFENGRKDENGNLFRFKGWVRYVAQDEQDSRPAYDVILQKQ